MKLIQVPKDNGEYKIRVMKEETESKKEEFASIIEKLKNKNL